MKPSVLLLTIVAVFCTALVSCQKSTKPPGPVDAIIATYQALETQDSSKFLETLTEEKREAYAINPSALRDKFAEWKGRHAEVKVLSLKQFDDTMAMVLYNVTITGRNPETDDSLLTRVLVENGEWKHGY